MVAYDEENARKTDRAYSTPDVARQRLRTLELLQLRAGETVLDVGCGSGLLVEEMATLVGDNGRVVGIDNSADMLSLAQQRCAGLSQVEFNQANAEQLTQADAYFDAAACVQVLLYVSDVLAALSEIYRVLKPGGRAVVIETDWRGTVLNSCDDTLTRRMLAAWDEAVSSPNLPVRMGPLLREQKFSAVRVDALPIVNTSHTSGSWSISMLEQFAEYAMKQGTVSDSEKDEWLADQQRRGADGSYFFCVNRFIFTAVK